MPIEFNTVTIKNPFCSKLSGSAQDIGGKGDNIKPVAIGGSLGVLSVVIVATVVIVCRKYVQSLYLFYIGKSFILECWATEVFNQELIIKIDISKAKVEDVTFSSMNNSVSTLRIVNQTFPKY